MSVLPDIALSVRQPWAWAIVFGGKDIENRSAGALRHMNFAGVDRIAIHASKGMTREEYEDAADFMASIGIYCPPAKELQRGGIIGSAKVNSIVRDHSSPWFMGPRGIVLEDQLPCEFIPAVGQLGLFKWRRADQSFIPEPAKWMLSSSEKHKKQVVETGTLL